MKYSNILGILAAGVLIIACFLPWAYYPDLDKTFTGFVTERNIYGKPGKFLIFFAVLAIVFFLIPRVWAKRANFIVSAILVAYGVKTFLLFTNCYQGFCPEKKIGIFLMILMPVVIVIASLIPRQKIMAK